MKNLFFASLAILISVLIGFNEVIASTIEDKDSINLEQTEDSINNISEGEKVKTKKSSQDLFGDEQTFPFVAGLGKNAAH